MKPKISMPVEPLTSDGKIIVIGMREFEDGVTLSNVAQFLKDHRDRADLAERLWTGQYDVYDQTLYPQRGDAFDAITAKTEVVVALHLYGIDQMPVPDAVLSERQRRMHTGYMYRGRDGRNGFLLQLCMQLRIPLVAWGDQPWLGLEKKTQINSNSLWIYEPGGDDEDPLRHRPPQTARTEATDRT